MKKRIAFFLGILLIIIVLAAICIYKVKAETIIGETTSSLSMWWGVSEAETIKNYCEHPSWEESYNEGEKVTRITCIVCGTVRNTTTGETEKDGTREIVISLEDEQKYNCASHSYKELGGTLIQCNNCGYITNYYMKDQIKLGNMGLAEYIRSIPEENWEKYILENGFDSRMSYCNSYGRSMLRAEEKGKIFPNRVSTSTSYKTRILNKELWYLYERLNGGTFKENFDKIKALILGTADIELRDLAKDMGNLDFANQLKHLAINGWANKESYEPPYYRDDANAVMLDLIGYLKDIGTKSGFQYYVKGKGKDEMDVNSYESANNNFVSEKYNRLEVDERTNRITQKVFMTNPFPTAKDSKITYQSREILGTPNINERKEYNGAISYILSRGNALNMSNIESSIYWAGTNQGAIWEVAGNRPSLISQDNPQWTTISYQADHLGVEARLYDSFVQEVADKYNGGVRSEDLLSVRYKPTVNNETDIACLSSNKIMAENKVLVGPIVLDYVMRRGQITKYSGETQEEFDQYALQNFGEKPKDGTNSIDISFGDILTATMYAVTIDGNVEKIQSGTGVWDFVFTDNHKDSTYKFPEPNETSFIKIEDYSGFISKYKGVQYIDFTFKQVYETTAEYVTIGGLKYNLYDWEAVHDLPIYCTDTEDEGGNDSDYPHWCPANYPSKMRGTLKKETAHKTYNQVIEYSLEQGMTKDYSDYKCIIDGPHFHFIYPPGEEPSDYDLPSQTFELPQPPRGGPPVPPLMTEDIKGIPSETVYLKGVWDGQYSLWTRLKTNYKCQLSEIQYQISTTEYDLAEHEKYCTKKDSNEECETCSSYTHSINTLNIYNQYYSVCLKGAELKLKNLEMATKVDRNYATACNCKESCECNKKGIMINAIKENGESGTSDILVGQLTLKIGGTTGQEKYRGSNITTVVLYTEPDSLKTPIAGMINEDLGIDFGATVDAHRYEDHVIGYPWYLLRNDNPTIGTVQESLTIKYAKRVPIIYRLRVKFKFTPTPPTPTPPPTPPTPPNEDEYFPLTMDLGGYVWEDYKLRKRRKR